jgi:hypothetical protein
MISEHSLSALDGLIYWRVGTEYTESVKPTWLLQYLGIAIYERQRIERVITTS